MIFVVWSMDGLEVKVELSDLLNIYDNYIRNNCKNKRKILNYEKKKMIHLYNLYDDFNSNKYVMGNYNIFMIRYPKHRIVMSLNVSDKIINHYVTMKYIIPSLEKYLDNRNIATRTGFGNDYGIRLLKKYLEINKKYDKFYILKLDIKKYFYNIDHEILISMLKDKIDDEVFPLVCDIINSTDKEYINEKINLIKNTELEKNYNEEIANLPTYKKGKGLPIGNMTSQFFAIFYLNALDHYIIHDLHLKYYIRYMDDFLIIHHDKKYLDKCQKIIEEKLNKEYKLELNRKSKIYSSDEGFDFLGYNFKVYHKQNIVNISRKSYYSIKRNILSGDKILNDFNRYSNYDNSFKYTNDNCVKSILYNYYD